MARRQHDEPKFHCKDCRDQGYLTVFSAQFAEQYRGQFDHDREQGLLARGFYVRVFKYWRERPDYMELGPIQHTAICDCNGKRAQALARGLALWRDPPKDAKGNLVPQKHPAVGCHWRRDLCPIWPNSLDDDLYRSLDEFYAASATLF